LSFEKGGSLDNASSVIIIKECPEEKMKRTVFIISVFLLLASFGKSFAVDVPPAPIQIDISNSTFEKVDSQQFRIRDLAAPGHPGTYWVNFLWNPNNLIF
jgi:hypothetical protein